MAIASAIFWVLGFILSVTIAPQLRIWTWGPTTLCLGLSASLALPLMWRERKGSADLLLVVSASAFVSWIAIRASVSPVSELAYSDICLAAMAVATFVAFRAARFSKVAECILFGGIALIAVASLWVVFRQTGDSSYSPIFPSIDRKWATGFYGHYSYGASFFVALFPFFAAFAAHSKASPPIRILSMLLAAGSLWAINATHSRGAILGVACAFCSLVAYTLIVGRRDGRKWFGPAVITFPILIGIGAALLYYALDDSQNARAGDAGISGMFDNSIRLYLLNIAVSCIGLHPLLGGGSRAFSWECYRFWDMNYMGQGLSKPEHVHNEFIQTAVDYGIVGATLLLSLLTITLIVATLGILTKPNPTQRESSDFWRIAGISGLVGLFVQSNFEGIFRISPGAILLAACIAAACTLRPDNSPVENHRPWIRSSIVTLMTLLALVPLCLVGIKGSRVSRILWPSFFGDAGMGLERRIDDATSAIEIWPLQSLIQHRANLSQRAAGSAPTVDECRNLLGLALDDFIIASELHPFDPASHVASANILGSLGRSNEAENHFERALKLQGEMEAAFQAHFMFAKHMHRKAIATYRDGNVSDALSELQIASKHVEKAFNASWLHNQSQVDKDMRRNIHESTGKVLEDLRQYREALAEYDFTSRLPDGSGANYRSSVLLGKLAVAAWSERRPSDALRLFMDAYDYFLKAHTLPDGVTPEMKAEYFNYLDGSIRYLKGAKITPSTSVDY